jgi:hypothetical protein
MIDAADGSRLFILNYKISQLTNNELSFIRVTDSTNKAVE